MRYGDLRAVFPNFSKFTHLNPTTNGASAIFQVRAQGAVQERDQILKLIRMPDAKSERTAVLARCEREFGLPHGVEHHGIVRMLRRIGECMIPLAEGGSQLHFGYSMEACECNVETVIARNCTIPQRLDIIRDLLDSVGYLHALSIVHRDIKPHNVLLWRRPGHPSMCKLADFTFALDLRDLDRTGVLPDQGTQFYRAPECVPQAPEPLDYRKADQFSLGVTIYQILSCGRLPWRPTGSASGGIKYEPLIIPSGDGQERMPKAAPSVDLVLRTMMTKLPEDRYPDIAACTSDLRASLLNDGLPIWSNLELVQMAN